MSERLKVGAPATLLGFLEGRLQGWRRGTLKDRLRRGCIEVNGRTSTRHDHPLQPGDEVAVLAKAARPHGIDAADATPGAAPPLTRLYEDDDLIVVDKPPGLLSVPTDDPGDRTVLSMVRESLASPGSRRRVTVWPVHRLDRETSGVLLLARSRDLCKALQRGWSQADKSYVAVVSGHPSPAEGVIDQPLWQDKSLKVHVGRREGCRDARTRFRTQRTGADRALLEVRLDTGRRHQIRAHMAWLGHPVVGDKRYGSAGLDGRLALHAMRLEVTDPRTGLRLVFEAPPPDKLLALVRGRG